MNEITIKTLIHYPWQTLFHASGELGKHEAEWPEIKEIKQNSWHRQSMQNFYSDLLQAWKGDLSCGLKHNET